jgi:hypothetical protein
MSRTARSGTAAAPSVQSALLHAHVHHRPVGAEVATDLFGAFRARVSRAAQRNVGRSGAAASLTMVMLLAWRLQRTRLALSMSETQLSLSSRSTIGGA